MTVPASRDHTARLCGRGTPYDPFNVLLWNGLLILTSNRIRCKTRISRKAQAIFWVWHSCFQWMPKAMFYWSRTIFHLFCSWAQSNLLFCIKITFVSLNNYTLVSVIKQVRRRLLQVENMHVFYISPVHQRYLISLIHINNAEKKNKVDKRSPQSQVLSDLLLQEFSSSLFWSRFFML